jgi:hypothetical protein
MNFFQIRPVAILVFAFTFILAAAPAFAAEKQAPAGKAAVVNGRFPMLRWE